MTTIDPFASVRLPTAQDKTETRATSEQFGKDTFLKLLVAQLRFQNPMQPTDSSEFLAQTAQFTMVEKLEEIEKQNKAAASANEVLAAASMIGKSVTWKAPSGTPAAATSKVSFGGNLAANSATGTTFETTTDVYTSAGKKVPLRVTMSKLENADGTDGTAWQMHVYSGNVEVGAGSTVTFDANGERTSADVTLAATHLDNITGTAGGWPAGGIVLSGGQPNDASRLRANTGATTYAVREQNGGDGTTFSGIVSALKIDATNGALLHIGDHDVALTSVTDIQVPKV